MLKAIDISSLQSSHPDLDGVDVAYGVGAEYGMCSNGFRLDYTKYDFDGVDGDSWSLSYVRKF